MPLLIAAGIGGALGLGTGLFVGKFFENLSDAVKWTAIGAGVLVGARYLKVI
jgi:hypothetical protein